MLLEISLGMAQQQAGRSTSCALRRLTWDPHNPYPPGKAFSWQVLKRTCCENDLRHAFWVSTAGCCWTSSGAWNADHGHFSLCLLFPVYVSGINALSRRNPGWIKLFWAACVFMFLIQNPSTNKLLSGAYVPKGTIRALLSPIFQMNLSSRYSLVLGSSAGYPDEYFSDFVFLKMLSSWFCMGGGRACTGWGWESHSKNESTSVCSVY